MPAVIGEKSKEFEALWDERHQLLLDWLPDVEPYILERAGHLLEVENPRGLAEALASFFARHAIGTLD